MRLLFVTDARSPISQNWMRYFAGRGDELYLASTFSCNVDFPVKRMEITPVAFSAVRTRTGRAGGRSSGMLKLRTVIRQWLGPLTVRRSAQKLRGYIREVEPDLVHAMRIPFEGMLAADAHGGVPLLVSVWGNDFTLHAPSTPVMKEYTRWTLRVADALHADAARDIRLAHEWGLAPEKPTLVTPGNGGVRTEIFHPSQDPVAAPIIVNPRGFRAYINNEAFFKSIPLVLAKRADARFICASMEGESQALRWVRELAIGHAVQLKPAVPYSQMGDIFRGAQIVVSPSTHDGTPNSLLEGMACGCFPVAGDLESIREWITPWQNGLLMDPNDPQAIAEALLVALDREDLRREAAGLNLRLIATRAEYQLNMRRVKEFYESIA